MGKKKTTFTWILLVLLAIVIIIRLFSVIGAIGQLVAPAGATALAIIGFLVQAVTLALFVVYFVKLYNIRPDVVQWTHIAFGANCLSIIWFFIAAFLAAGLLAIFAAPFLLIGLVITVCMWVGITMHLNRAKRENLMDFS